MRMIRLGAAALCGTFLLFLFAGPSASRADDAAAAPVPSDAPAEQARAADADAKLAADRREALHLLQQAELELREAPRPRRWV